MERKEREAHLKKLQDKPFSQMAKKQDAFVDVKGTYGEDRVYPQRKPRPEEVPPMTHDAPFKPSNPPKRGYNKTLEKFPKY